MDAIGYLLFLETYQAAENFTYPEHINTLGMKATKKKGTILVP
jgi:hypothetical protein